MDDIVVAILLLIAVPNEKKSTALRSSSEILKTSAYTLSKALTSFTNANFLSLTFVLKVQTKLKRCAGIGCIFCEGGGDVVGVVTPLVGGVAQAFHDDRVVELRVQLGVQEVEGKDRDEQMEVEREKRVKEVRPWI